MNITNGTFPVKHRPDLSATSSSLQPTSINLKPPLNPLLSLNLPLSIPLLPNQTLQILHITTTSRIPLRINILQAQIRAAIRLLRAQTVLHRPAQSQELPRVLAEPLDSEVFVARDFEQFHVVHRRARVDGVDAAGFVIFVPAAAAVFPDRVFDPFLGLGVSGVAALGFGRVSKGGSGFYLDVLIELVCDVLSWNPAAKVFVLHFLDPLDGIFGDCVQWTHDAAVWEGVSLLIMLNDVSRKLVASTHCESVSNVQWACRRQVIVTFQPANWGQ
jgi:hypothetical protein